MELSFTNGPITTEVDNFRRISSQHCFAEGILLEKIVTYNAYISTDDHYHRNTHETLVLLAGEGLLITETMLGCNTDNVNSDRRVQRLRKNWIYYIEPSVAHRVELGPQSEIFIISKSNCTNDDPFTDTFLYYFK